MINLSLGCFRGFVEICSTVWCSTADTHLNLLDRVVSDARFLLTGGVLECNIAHRRSVAALCLLYKIRCNALHPLYGALRVLYVQLRITRGFRSHIGIFMLLLAAEPFSTTGLLLPSQGRCGTIFLT